MEKLYMDDLVGDTCRAYDMDGAEDISNITFGTLYDILANEKNPNEILGVTQEGQREFICVELARASGLSYDEISNMWDII